MGDDGVKRQRIGVVQHTMIQRTVGGLGLAHTAAGQPAVPQRLGHQKRSGGIRRHIIIAVGAGRAVGKLAEAAPRRKSDSGTVTGLRPVDLMADRAAVFLNGLQGIVGVQHGLNGLLQGSGCISCRQRRDAEHDAETAGNKNGEQRFHTSSDRFVRNAFSPEFPPRGGDTSAGNMHEI